MPRLASLHLAISPQGYGFNSNSSMKFRVNAVLSKSTVNLSYFNDADFQ
jgi:hypothetical protein